MDDVEGDLVGSISGGAGKKDREQEADIWTQLRRANQSHTYLDRTIVLDKDVRKAKTAMRHLTVVEVVKGIHHLHRSAWTPPVPGAHVTCPAMAATLASRW